MQKITGIILRFFVIIVFVLPVFTHEIHEAAEKGDLEKVKIILEKAPDLINERDDKSRTPLHWACRSARMDVVKYLVNKGADVNAADMYKITPLLSLSYRGGKEGLELLLKKGADVNLKDSDGMDALFYAAYGGKLESAEILIENGVVINNRDQNGLTPTDIAMGGGYTELAEFIISKGGLLTPLADAKVVKMSKNIFKITYFFIQPTNIFVLSGDEGLLLMDTGFPRTSDKLRKELDKIAGGKIKYIINTHDHIDHVGGNKIALKDTVIIDLKNLDKMVSDGNLEKRTGSISGGPGKGSENYYILHFDKQEIRMLPLPGSHTDTDMIIYIPNQGIVHMGDLLIPQSFPSLTRGLVISKYLKILDDVINVFPEGTKFTGGHGRDISGNELRNYRKMLLDTIKIVMNGIKAGKSVREMQEGKLLVKFKSYDTFIPELDTNFWIDAVYKNYHDKKDMDHLN